MLKAILIICIPLLAIAAFVFGFMIGREYGNLKVDEEL